MNMLKKILRKFSGKPAPLRLLSEVYPQYEVGPHSYGGLTIRHFNSPHAFKMGDYCSVAADVKVMLGGNHRMDWVTTYPFNVTYAEHAHFKGHPASNGGVTIGSDVWIGDGAIIMSGIRIGNGAVVAARSVVVKDVDDYAIVGGNPAKHLKYRFDETTISRLLAVAWWDWPEERVSSAMPLLLQNDIAKFLDAAERGQI